MHRFHRPHQRKSPDESRWYDNPTHNFFLSEACYAIAIECEYYPFDDCVHLGGAGCTFNWGSSTSSSWHHFYMGESNTDTYLYLKLNPFTYSLSLTCSVIRFIFMSAGSYMEICNGNGYSSGQNLNHRHWFREGILCQFNAILASPLF